MYKRIWQIHPRSDSGPVRNRNETEIAEYVAPVERTLAGGMGRPCGEQCPRGPAREWKTHRRDFWTPGYRTRKRGSASLTDAERVYGTGASDMKGALAG